MPVWLRKQLRDPDVLLSTFIHKIKRNWLNDGMLMIDPQ